MSAYKSNPTTNGATASVSIAPPLSIMAFMGGTDPDGWVICDGQLRTNGSDGKYNTLIAALLGTGTPNSANFTPPDFRGAFLRGAGTSPYTWMYRGNQLGLFQPHATQKHNHEITDPGHYHLHKFRQAYNDATYLPGTVVPRFSTGDWSRLTEKAHTDITINGSTGTYVDDYETRPFNYSVNWIMKL